MGQNADTENCETLTGLKISVGQTDVIKHSALYNQDS